MWIEIKRLGLSSFAFWSPSARKVWIEMQIIPPCDKAVRSPSARKVWIEMGHIEIGNIRQKESPSARKVWIEIPLEVRNTHLPVVAFRKEGVD